MGPLYILFAATGLYFWIVLLLSSICIVTALERESLFWATIALLATALGLYFFTDAYARFHCYLTWTNLGIMIVSYILGGFIWGTIKWHFFLKDRRELYDDVLETYKEKHNIGDRSLTTEERTTFHRYLSSAYLEFRKPIYNNSHEPSFQIRPRPRHHKAFIINNMVYWPWSLFWSLFDDIIRTIFRRLYQMVAGLYDRMSVAAFSDIPEI